MRKIIIGIMGPGESASEKDQKNAASLGSLIAKEDWILLTGGRNQGVMDAASQGAKEAGGLVLGILPSKTADDCSKFVDIAIITGMGSARNPINILSSDIVVACGMGAGTASEVAHAIKAKKPVILLTENTKAIEFFTDLKHDIVYSVKTTQETITLIKKLLETRNKSI